MPDRTGPAPGSEDPAELRRRLRSHVARFCPPWLRDHTDDITQVAWMRLEKARLSDRNRHPGTTLIARVAFCAAMDESRKLRRRREVMLDPSTDVRGPRSTEPAAAFRAAEVRRGIQQCLLALSRNRSLAVTLHLQGHSAPAASRLLGWSLYKTENLIYRGLADLRRCLAGKGITP